VSDEFHHRDRCQPSPNGIGAAGEDDRHARAENNPRSIRACQVLQLFGEHIARFEIGDKKNVGVSRNGRCNFFLFWPLLR